VLTKLSLLRRKLEAGQDISAQARTLGGWLHEWLTDVKATDGTRPSTLRSYKWLITAHIVPTLGRIPLDTVTANDIRKLITAKTREGLSPATVNHIRGVLRNALSEAERLNLVTRNVARSVRGVKVPRHEYPTVTVEDARRVLGVVRGHRLHALFAVALITGLRRGEALGLSWDDVDFGAGTLHIRHSLQRVDGALLLTETKSKASTGYVPAPPSLLKILGRHKAQQQAERLALGERWPDTGLVFTSTTGTACEPRNVSRDWERLRAQAGAAPRPTWSSPRRTPRSTEALDGGTAPL